MMEAHSQVVAAPLEVGLPDESAEAEAVLPASVVNFLVHGGHWSPEATSVGCYLSS